MIIIIIISPLKHSTFAIKWSYSVEILYIITKCNINSNCRIYMLSYMSVLLEKLDVHLVNKRFSLKQTASSSISRHFVMVTLCLTSALHLWCLKMCEGYNHLKLATNFIKMRLSKAFRNQLWCSSITVIYSKWFCPSQNLVHTQLKNSLKILIASFFVLLTKQRWNRIALKYRNHTEISAFSSARATLYKKKAF